MTAACYAVYEGSFILITDILKNEASVVSDEGLNKKTKYSRIKREKVPCQRGRWKFRQVKHKVIKAKHIRIRRQTEGAYEFKRTGFFKTVGF